jgi:hypothetical protein
MAGFLMDRQRPSGVLPQSPIKGQFYTKLALGVIFLMLLSGYQPSFQFPPVKKNIAYASETTQTKTVEAQSTSLIFQSPHPGYLTTRFSGYHPGIDLATGLGMPIKPIAQGKVSYAGFTFFGLGLVVEIDHGEGYKSIYAHMGATYVKPDQEVDVNDYLGEVGLTGHTSGPHTHLEVYKDGKPVDPLTLLPAQRDQPQESDFVAVGGKVEIAPVIKATPTPTVPPTPVPTPTPTPLPTPPAPIVEKNTSSIKLELVPPSPNPIQVKQSASLKNVLSLFSSR